MLHTRPPVNNTLCTKNNQITDSYTGKHTCGDLNVQTQAMTEGLEIYFRRFYYHMNWSLYHIGCWSVFSGMQLWDKTGRGGADTGICKQITVWLHVLLSAFLMHISLICYKMSIIFSRMLCIYCHYLYLLLTSPLSEESLSNHMCLNNSIRFFLMISKYVVSLLKVVNLPKDSSFCNTTP